MVAVLLLMERMLCFSTKFRHTSFGLPALNSFRKQASLSLLDTMETPFQGVPYYIFEKLVRAGEAEGGWGVAASWGGGQRLPTPLKSQWLLQWCPPPSGSLHAGAANMLWHCAGPK